MHFVFGFLTQRFGVGRIALGNIIMITALLLYVVADAICKGFLVHYTPYQVTFFRTTARLLPIIFICFAKSNNPFNTFRLKEHLFRAVIASINTIFFIAAYKYSPMTDVHAIGYTTAIFMLPFSYFILKEKIHKNVITAVIAGLIGVVLVLKPHNSVEHYMNIGALLALSGAICSALNSVLIRRLTTTESLYSIMFFHNMVLFVISLVLALSFWISVDDIKELVLYFAIIGVIGTSAQYMISLAFSMTKASELAVTSYIVILPIMLIDIFVWNVQPDKLVMLGLALIVFCNYFVIKQQRKDA